MEMAHIVAKRSTCYRLNVGAVVTVDNRIVSIGYNGPPSGEPHCTGVGCATDGRCTRSIHAEINALYHMPIVSNVLTMYVTDSPCEHCFEEITKIHWAVDRVFFSNLYRINNHLVHPQVKLYRVMANGLIIDYQTGELIDGEV